MITAVEQTLLQSLFPFLKTPKAHLLYKDLLQTAKVAQLKKGDSICNEGIYCAHIALLLEGTARIYKLDEAGHREITLYRISTGESCILTASCILSEQTFPAFALAETSVTAIIIPARQVKQWMDHYSIWRQFIFDLIAARLGAVISVIEEITFKEVISRLLKELEQQQKVKLSRGSLEIL